MQTANFFRFVLFKKSFFNLHEISKIQLMAKNLVIVESPAKKKIIQGFLGKDFVVESSIGHIRDLPKKGGMAIDIENGFAPNYVISEDKTKVVSQLKSIVKQADTVWLATDEDREGEAIAWHLTEALKLDAFEQGVLPPLYGSYSFFVQGCKTMDSEQAWEGFLWLSRRLPEFQLPEK